MLATMRQCLKVPTAMIVVIISLIPPCIFAHKPMELSSDTARENYLESPERHPIGNDRDFPSSRLHIFSEDDSNLFEKSHPRMKNLEENKMAIELQKRVSGWIDEPDRRRIDFPENKLNKFLLSNWEMVSNGRRFRRPLLMRSYVDGSYKVSYPPGKKRPYYYSEPEGSEFLGGPGK
ncbi:hypothetical protein AVEN_146163-1 [Araneus ventricosus]|uniref:Uncharacterized protein n=1 Tax=Araneus ventricosus TaxID=182803 RepID=A0A4Y2EFL3_ARAVE|nr:hypothetical protein AVEN_146163-1 [Araneus ventricosus]